MIVYDERLSLPSTESPRRFGDLLRRLRIERQVSQRNLAERAGISAEAISTLERGFRRVPRVQTLALLSSALQLSADEALAFDRAASGPARPRRRGQRVSIQRSPYPVPRSSKSLLGRHKDLTAITALLSDNRLVSIIGAGGIGKTAVAIDIAQKRETMIEPDVCFLDFARSRDGSALLSNLASMLVVDIRCVRSPIDALMQDLKSRSLFLVFDNCEHLVRDVGMLAERIVSACPGVRVLTTSRVALGVESETVYNLPTLPLKDSVSIFVARAKQVDAAFTFSDRNAPIITEICRNLDGIALAIELAASRTRALTLQDILGRLDDRFRLLTSGHKRSARQESLRALCDWSYNLLSPSDRKVFDALGVFGDSFSIRDAHAVLGNSEMDDFATLDRLDVLVANSLLNKFEDCEKATRFSLSQTLRYYAREHLSVSAKVLDQTPGLLEQPLESIAAA